MNNQIILIGGFIEIIELCKESEIDIIGIVDNNSNKKYRDIPIIGSDDNVLDWRNDFFKYKLLISPDLPAIRKKLFLLYNEYGFKFSTLVSKFARISKSSFVDLGTVIQSGTNISSEVHIGKFVKINTNANVMHNSSLGDFTSIAPNAVVLGHVNIGESCYIGANSTILPHIRICDNVIVGAGAVVTKNIEKPYTTYAGVPARILKKII